MFPPPPFVLGGWGAGRGYGCLKIVNDSTIGEHLASVLYVQVMGEQATPLELVPVGK